MKNLFKSTLLIVFLFSFLLSPSLTQAQNQTDINSNVSIGSCVDLKNNLKYRDRDNYKDGEVTILQNYLQSQNYLNSKPSGYFGVLTVKAVINFQKNNDIQPAVGIVGPLTKDKIKSLTCGEVQNCPDGYIGVYPNCKIAICDYPQPPLNCSYIQGPEYNKTNQCGMILECNKDICPSGSIGIYPDCKIENSKPVVIFSANPTEVASGGSTTLKWSAQGVSSCVASGDWTGTKAAYGLQSVVNLTSNKTYILTCTNASGVSTQKEATVNVNAQQIPTVSFIASSTSIQSGNSVTLSWSSTNATTCVASDGWLGTKATSGAEIIPNLTTPTNFTLTCTGTGGSTKANTKVEVYIVDPIICPTDTTGIYPNCIPVSEFITVTYPNNTETFTAGQKINVTWTTRPELTNSQTVKIIITEIGVLSGFPKTLVESTLNDGQELITLPTSPGASFKIQIVAVWNRVTLFDSSNNYFSVIPTLCPAGTTGTYPNCVPIPATLTLTATPSSLYLGGQSNLSWTSTNATTCTAGNSWSGSKTLNGNETINIGFLGTKTYSITCTNSVGSTTDSVSITSTQNPLYLPGCVSELGYSITTGQSCSKNIPTVSLIASPSTVAFGESTTLTWASTNATSCTASNTWAGDKATSGSLTFGILVYNSSTYKLTCTGPGGTSSATAIVNVSSQAPLGQASLDKTPRVAIWGTKFSQYLNDKGFWTSDLNSGFVHTNEILGFCKKWYPSTTSYEYYQEEFIPNWVNLSTGAQETFSGNHFSYKCVGGTHSGPSKVLGASTEAENSIKSNNSICTLSKTLMKGMQDNEVKCLQKKLNEKGYQIKGTGNGKEITFFGYNTELILKKFQKENNLIPDGILGIKSKELLNN